MKPMLAYTIEDISKLRMPAMVSPKLDGIRCMIIGSQALTRKGKPIPNKYIQSLLSGRPWLNGLDGELIVGEPTGRDTFSRAQSGVMSHDGEPDFTFYVFDDFSINAKFWERLESAGERLRGCPHARGVPHFQVGNLARLESLERQFLSLGYEGAMVRDPDGPYKNGRSTGREGYLGKLKRFKDAEARIIGFEELIGFSEDDYEEIDGETFKKEGAIARPQGRLGALLAEGLNGEFKGVKFNIGTGFDAVLRQNIWDNRPLWFGSVVKYKYFPVGVVNAPRHPVYLGIRED